MSNLELQSTITCPSCGFQKTETMPTNACQWFYECCSCHELLKPLPGDCCVFCSYGTVKCPPIQLGSSCCSRDGA
ncbi:MAG: GDCCVxC domain-containing (seleno)protein [Dokdonella sp.]|uniref:GDCCVxC domain-containing (seleno)protein n=1 Tax=Dokdonella sp. TaxID=2291710 RepID=UPI003BB00781